MNRRNFIRNSIVLGALAGISNPLWAGTGRSAQILLPAAPLHIRHGLLQAASIAQPISQCRWLLGLSQNNFLRNGLDSSEIPFQHIDLQLEAARIGIGIKGEQIWLCTDAETLELETGKYYDTGVYQLTVVHLQNGEKHRPSSINEEWIILPVSGKFYVNGQSVVTNSLSYIQSEDIAILAVENEVKLLLIGK